MADPISEAVQQFLWRWVDSVMQLEAMLLLYTTRPREWTIDAIVTELRIDPAGGRQQLQAMLDNGTMVSSGDNAAVVLGPAIAQQLDLLSEVNRLYHERRVAIVTIIYTKPSQKKPDALQEFADAFRIYPPKSRKDKEGHREGGSP